MYHLKTPLRTWKTIMRPELQQREPWKLSLDKGTPEFNKLLNEQMNWWREVNTDKLGKTIMNFLDNGGTIRYGILQKFLIKADKPDHLRVMMRSLTWLQARWNRDMSPEISVPLSKLIYRTGAIDFGLRILNAPWMRIWPSIKTTKYLMLLCVELAEKEAFKSPRIIYRKYVTPETKAEDDFLKIPKRRLKVREYHLPIEEEDEEKVDALKLREMECPKEVHQSYLNVYKYITDERFEITLDHRLHFLNAEYWALKGNIEKVNQWIEKMQIGLREREKGENGSELKKLKKITQKMQHASQHLIPTAYLVKNQPTKVLEILKVDIADKVNPLEVNEDKVETDGTKPNPLVLKEDKATEWSIKTRRAIISAYLMLGEEEKAYQCLKDGIISNSTRLEWIQVHMGDPGRFQIVQNMFKRLSNEESVQLDDQIVNYLEQSQAMFLDKSQ